MPEPDVPMVFGFDPSPDGDCVVYVAPAGTAVDAASWADLGWTTDELLVDQFNELLRERYAGRPTRGPYARGGYIMPPSSGSSDHVHIDMRRGCPPLDYRRHASYHQGPMAIDVMAPPGYQPATVRRSYATRATATTDQVADQRPDPAGGVDDLTASIEGLCACPCRQRLDPDGPSAYFSSQECQREWARTTQADRPDDVERRPDWMPGFMETAYHHRTVAADPAAVHALTGIGEPELRALTDPELAYRRRCAGCDVTAVPDTTEQVQYLRLNAELHVGSRLVTTQCCANCGDPFDGPVYTASITDEPGDVAEAVRLRLTDGTFWTSYALDVAGLRHLGQAEREATINLAWWQMQLQLAARSMVPDALRARFSFTGHGTIFDTFGPAGGIAELVGMSIRNPRASTVVTDVI